MARNLNAQDCYKIANITNCNVSETLDKARIFKTQKVRDW